MPCNRTAESECIHLTTAGLSSSSNPSPTDCADPFLIVVEDTTGISESVNTRFVITSYPGQKGHI